MKTYLGLNMQVREVKIHSRTVTNDLGFNPEVLHKVGLLVLSKIHKIRGIYIEKSG